MFIKKVSRQFKERPNLTFNNVVELFYKYSLTIETYNNMLTYKKVVFPFASINQDKTFKGVPEYLMPEMKDFREEIIKKEDIKKEEEINEDSDIEEGRKTSKKVLSLLGYKKIDDSKIDMPQETSKTLYERTVLPYFLKDNY